MVLATDMLRVCLFEFVGYYVFWVDWWCLLCVDLRCVLVVVFGCCLFRKIVDLWCFLISYFSDGSRIPCCVSCCLWLLA